MKQNEFTEMDKTRIEPDATTPDNPEYFIPEEQETEDTPQKEEKKSMGKNFVAGAAGAAVGASMASVLMGFTTETGEPVEPEATGQSASYNPEFMGDQVPVSDAVTGDMSYSEAFAAARADVGPGGVFFYNGGVYGTYYSNEWDQLSEEYKTQFSNYPYQQPDALSENNEAGNPHAHTGEELPPATEQEEAVSVNLEEPVQEEVQILQAEIDGQIVDYVEVNIDGQDSVYIDLDRDGIIDGAFVDNGTDTPDVHDLQGFGMRFEDLPVVDTPKTDDYLANAGMDDYTSDGSVELFT